MGNRKAIAMYIRLSDEDGNVDGCAKTIPKKSINFKINFHISLKLEVDKLCLFISCSKRSKCKYCEYKCHID